MQLQQQFCYYAHNKATLPEPQPLTLATFHAAIKSGTLTTAGDIHTAITNYRTTGVGKNELPIAYLAGTFGENHAADTLTHFTGYLTLDFDKLTDEQTAYLFKTMRPRSYVHLIFRSPSNNGLKIIVQAEMEPDKDVFKALYYAIHQHIAGDVKNQLTKDKSHEFDTLFPNGFPPIDENAGKLAQGCYFSYDNNGALNPDPTTFTSEEVQQLLARYKKPGTDTATPQKPTNSPRQTDENKAVLVLQSIINALKISGKSITNNYGQWLAVACGIKATLGADGLQYFLELSKQDKTYKESEAKSLYVGLDPKLLQHSIGTVIFYAVGVGVKLQDNLLKETFSDIAFIENYLRSRFKFRTNEISGNVEIAKHESLPTWNAITDSDYNFWYVQLKKVRINYTETDKNDKVTEKSRALYVNVSDIVCVINNTVFSPPVNPIIERFKTLHKKYFIDANNVPVNDLTEVNKWISVFTYNGTSYKDYWLNWFSGVITNLTENVHYDRILTLTGTPGTGKTHGILHNLMASFSDYVTTDFSWNTDKTDDIRRIASNLFVFDDELKTSRKSDVDTIKAVLSKTRIDYRAPYARTNTSAKRIASFIATCNQKEMLTDLTGNRRFLVLDVTAGNRTLRNSIRYDKLWAEVWNYFYVNKQTHEVSDAIIEANNKQHLSKLIEEDYLCELFDFERVGNIKEGRADRADIVLKTIKLIKYINDNTNAGFRTDMVTKTKITKVLNHYGIYVQRDSRHNGVKGDYWHLKTLSNNANRVSTGFGTDAFTNSLHAESNSYNNLMAAAGKPSRY